MRLTRQEAFEELEVTENADEVLIKKAYRRLAMQWHPDKNQGSEEATKKFQRINAAYKKLTSPDEDEDDDVDIDEEAAFEFFMYMMSQMLHRPTPFPGMRGRMYCGRPGCSCGYERSAPATYIFSEDDVSDGYDDDSSSWFTDDGHDDGDDYASWQDSRRSQERRRKAQEDKQATYQNMLRREAALKEERKQKWLRQLPRPTLTSRTEGSISVSVERKGRSSEFADPHLPSNCQWELEYRGVSDTEWHAVRFEGSTSTGMVTGLQPGSKVRLRARTLVLGDDDEQTTCWGEYSVESQYATAGRCAPEQQAVHEATAAPPSSKKKGKKVEEKVGDMSGSEESCPAHSEKGKKGKAKAQGSTAGKPTKQPTAEELKQKQKADAEREASMRRAMEAAAAEYQAELEAARKAKQKEEEKANGDAPTKKKKHKNKSKKKTEPTSALHGPGWDASGSSTSAPTAPPASTNHASGAVPPMSVNGNTASSAHPRAAAASRHDTRNGSGAASRVDPDAIAVEEAIQLAMALEESRQMYELEQSRSHAPDSETWESEFPSLSSQASQKKDPSKQQCTSSFDPVFNKPHSTTHMDAAVPPSKPVAAALMKATSPTDSLHSSYDSYPSPPPPPARQQQNGVNGFYAANDGMAEGPAGSQAVRESYIIDRSNPGVSNTTFATQPKQHPVPMQRAGLMSKHSPSPGATFDCDQGYNAKYNAPAAAAQELRAGNGTRHQAPTFHSASQGPPRGPPGAAIPTHTAQSTLQYNGGASSLSSTGRVFAPVPFPASTAPVTGRVTPPPNSRASPPVLPFDLGGTGASARAAGGYVNNLPSVHRAGNTTMPAFKPQVNPLPNTSPVPLKGYSTFDRGSVGSRTSYGAQSVKLPGKLCNYQLPKVDWSALNNTPDCNMSLSSFLHQVAESSSLHNSSGLHAAQAANGVPPVSAAARFTPTPTSFLDSFQAASVAASQPSAANGITTGSTYNSNVFAPHPSTLPQPPVFGAAGSAGYSYFGDGAPAVAQHPPSGIVEISKLVSELDSFDMSRLGGNLGVANGGHMGYSQASGPSSYMGNGFPQVPVAGLQSHAYPGVGGKGQAGYTGLARVPTATAAAVERATRPAHDDLHELFPHLFPTELS